MNYNDKIELIYTKFVSMNCDDKINFINFLFKSINFIFEKNYPDKNKLLQWIESLNIEESYKDIFENVKITLKKYWEEKTINVDIYPNKDNLAVFGTSIVFIINAVIEFLKYKMVHQYYHKEDEIKISWDIIMYIIYAYSYYYYDEFDNARLIIMNIISQNLLTDSLP